MSLFASCFNRLQVRLLQSSLQIKSKITFQFPYCSSTMAEYKLEVTTGEMLLAGTLDYIYVTLVGTEGQTERTELNNYGIDFRSGKTGHYTVTSPSTLGRILLVKLEKDPFLRLPESEWFCSKIRVTMPEGDAVLFPCYRWICRAQPVELRGGKAMKIFEEEHDLLVNHRRNELELHKQQYQWDIFEEGFPHNLKVEDSSELPAEVRFSFSKVFEFVYSKEKAVAELKLKGLKSSTEQWENFEAMKNIFWFNRTPISEYVSEHWKEDDFYGYQFLNGPNPNVIQCCTKLPLNFPVTDEMVHPFLEDGSSLNKEIEKGNIFLCDYKRMENMPTRIVNGDPLPLTAALCLFYKNQQDKLLPIAIQLGQQPSEQNPIFLPSDLEPDWLLAKMFVRHVECLQHQPVYHLLNTHLIAEAFTIATLRNFPVIHPLYKLLLPHFRYTLQINTFGRKMLLSEGGTLSESTFDLNGVKALMQKAHSETTYSSLCLPDNIAARGLESIPNFYYRDDGLKLWNIINNFVRAMVKHYYPSDSEVSRDFELQEWIGEVFTHGFLGNSSSGIPERFHTVEEVIKFITMVIFTSSAQHAAVNNGQFDYNSWLPNGCRLLRKGPPTIKGQSCMDTILETLPVKGDAVPLIISGWLLSRKHGDFIPLGTYPDEHFDEPRPKMIITEFEAELSFLNEAIVHRNSTLELPYNYLNPTEIENSIAI